MLGWSATTWRVRVAILLVVTAVTGPDDGKVIGIWPVGAAAGVLLLAPRRWALRLLAVVVLLGLGTVMAGGRPWGVAVGYALTIGAEVALVWALLSRGEEGSWVLRRDADLRRWLLACLLGGAVGAVGGALTSLVTGFGHASFVALALGTAHIGSLMVLTPLWASLPAHDSIAGRGEYALQWVMITVAAPLVFIPEDTPPMVYVLVPLLAWSALRISAPEALAQMILMMTLAIVLTTAGRGPFAAAPDVYGLDRDVRGVLLASFAVVCAVIVVPLILRVGESVEAAREAQTERDTLDRIVSSATGVAIIVTDEQSRIALFNPGAERMLGYRAEEVLGRSTSMLHSPAAVAAKAAELGVAPEFRTVAGELMRRSAEGVEMGFTRADGEERTHSMTLSRVTDEQGKVLGYVSTSEDVTDRIETEETLRAALERMREVDAVKDAFVSSVSHELRTPITSIHGYLEMLLDETLGELSPAQRSAVDKVASNSRRLLALIDDLLTLSRLQEDGLNLAPRLVDLRTVVADACGVVRPATETGGLALEVGVPDEPVPFLGDRDMLERALVNLVGNAVKFTPRGGEVTVILSSDADGATVAVSDTGIGIPLAEQELLFTRFFRSSLAQRQAIPGSGLGLSIARAVVDKHGGTLRVESEEGRGTTFYVELPALV